MSFDDYERGGIDRQSARQIDMDRQCTGLKVECQGRGQQGDDREQECNGGAHLQGRQCIAEFDRPRVPAFVRYG